MIIALCLVLALVGAVPAMAAGYVDAWLSADSTSVSAGNNVTVSVYADVDSCGDGGIKVSFDKSVFSLVSGNCSVSNAFMSTFQTSTGHGAFAFMDTSPVSGCAFQFALKVKDGAPSGSHTVTVTFTADGSSVTRSISISLSCDHTYDNGCDSTCNRCGATREVSHKYDSGKVTTTASCSKEGVKTYTCSSCGKTKTDAISKTAHSWDTGKVTKEATCSKEGVKTFTCSTCSTTKTEAISKTAHSWGTGKVTTEATCSKEGEKSYTCSACGETKTESVPTLRHNYEVIDYVAATCEEEGEISFKCVDCGYSYDDYIEAPGHSYENDCDEECDTCGEVREVEHTYADPEDEEAEITWLSDKTGHWQECELCKKPQDPTPHTPGPETTETDDQVCLDCGFVIKAAVAHVHKGTGGFLGDDDRHWFLCACGEVMGENDHRWEDKGIEDGQQIYKCIICSRVRTEPVETTAPTEVTTVPTEVTTAPTEIPETTAPKYAPIDHVGILVQWWWVIPVGIVALALLGGGIYMIIGMILAFRKPGKYAAKKKK